MNFFVQRLLSGPDDVELSDRELDLLEAILRQPLSLAAVRQEKKTLGRSPILEGRNKLQTILTFNRLQRANVGKLGQPSAPATPKPEVAERNEPQQSVDARRSGASVNARMLEVMQSNPDARGWSARQWAKHLGCSKSAVAATPTWKQLELMRLGHKAQQRKDRRGRYVHRPDELRD